VPALATRADRQRWADKVRLGEAAAVAAGYPAMLNPTAAEVEEKRAQAETEADELNAVRALRPQAIELAHDLIEELRHSTRKLEPGTARDVLRSYGVEFDYLPGEAPDAAVPANPPAAGGGATNPVPPAG
jgi:hypothetical protein